MTVTIVIIIVVWILVAGGKSETGQPSAAPAITTEQLIASDARISDLLEQFDIPFGRDIYLSQSMFEAWLRAAQPFAAVSPPNTPDPQTLREPLARLKRLQGIVSSPHQSRDARNAGYVSRQKAKHASLFSDSLGYPLNAEQISAILHDEDRALVVAGAGTGKTSTIVGKVLHTLAESLAKPEEILLLAFTRKAAEEMQQRLEALSVSGVKIKTFHSLGTEAIAQATGKRPSVSRLAEDAIALKKAIRGYVDTCLSDPVDRTAISEFIAYYRYPYTEPHSFNSHHQYLQHIDGHDVRTLRDEKVKSVEECIIANWLTMHAIRYEYERPYEHDTASVEHRHYRPDFYLPDYGIYLEHFAIDKQGQPPRWFDEPQKYLNGMQWKRALHTERGTTLVETFSRQVADGTVFSHLESELARHGVTIGAIAPEDLTALTRSTPVLDPFVDLLSSFLNLYKGNTWTQAELTERAARSGNTRAQRFVQVFQRVLSRYQDQLGSERAIDFADMVNEAVAHVREGRYRPGFKYILVDEYQDISRGRAQLLLALLDQVKRSRLFAVGDDWQSIFRFAGSDIELMTKFSEHFGYTRRTDLCITHRFNDRSLTASSQFIQANPQQLKKNLRSNRSSVLPSIEIISMDATPAPDAPGPEAPAALQIVLDTIARDCRDPRIGVLVLGRYHFRLESHRRALQVDPRLSLRFGTVHQAKGSEADFVVVVDVVGGRHGFPTEIVDDTLLDLVLAGRGSFPNAEERRLFYVALTRAKHKTYLITSDTRRSVFIDELEAPQFGGLVIPSGAGSRTAACPKCVGGRLVRRMGKWGVFWGCSNYPLCECVVKPCPWCGRGPFVREQNTFRCTDQSCGQTAPLCPSCGIGALVPRDGRFGKFWGCTEWRPEGASCGFTRKWH